MIGKAVVVRENVFGRILNEFDNGYETTAGFVQKPAVEINTWSITYDSAHARDLPFNWPDMQFIDDNNNRQPIKSIDFENDFNAYTMADGSKSMEVTE